MGCSNGEAEAALEMTEITFGDALLLATFCAVGLAVEVQVKDGSVYAGVFHTASLDEGYGIVLKKARIIEKGRCPNLEIGTIVDTLVVLSSELVQVIVKDFCLPMEGHIDYSVGDGLREGIEAGIGATSGNIDSNKENISIKFSGEADIHETHNVKKMLKSLDNHHDDLGGKDGCLCRDEVEELSCRPEVSVPEGQVGDSEVHAESNSSNHIEMDSSTKTVVCEADHSSSCSNKSISGDKRSNSPVSLSTRPSSSVSCDGNSTCSNMSTSPYLAASEGGPFCNTCTKEFKLNPEARLFLPSFASARSASAVFSTIVNTNYAPSIPSAMPVVAAQSSLEINSFPTCMPLPAKFVQYSPAVQTGISTQYPQTVMVGRTGQLVYVHPISQDPMQGTAVLSQGCPVLTPCHANIPKLQGSNAQSLQFCMTPPLVTAAPAQPFAIPNPIPFSSPVPAIRPITVPGGNGYFGSKFQ
ncbi:hypothetical protein KFK09_013635 [Dendrobium nobile]|uniref:Ataxin 2 SM domain-containing protein n=1 Tax=Dendrobium nobile TaxID=94219 RepID=A0A8T3B7T1_DENNO|nr:hypothetical protein KFK09_013635 [Dendrobium nobile]